MRDGAVVVVHNLTHLFPYQPRTALTSTAILDELDQAKNDEHDTSEADNTILEDVGFKLESKEIHGRGFGWDATDFHPLLVACDGSTLKVYLCQLILFE
jgi:hypothetical protein